MRADEVPSELVEKVERLLRADGAVVGDVNALARHILAAVLPEFATHIAELASLIVGILDLASDATEIEYGAPFTWEEVAKKRGRALDAISDRIIAFEPKTEAARLTTTTEEPK